jgi:hypothetical protein
MKGRKWSLAQLSQAANIAAKMANEGRASNPMFTQALLEMERMFREGKLVNNKSGVYLKIPVDGLDFSRRSNHE